MAVSENGFVLVLVPEGTLHFRDRLASGEALRTWDAEPGDTAALLSAVAAARPVVEDYHSLLPFVAECLGCNEDVAQALGITLDRLSIDLGYAVEIPAEDVEIPDEDVEP
ncbi:hypothetical protein [Novosphingobium clariflavum]|uniref:Uncharacterized protein n=1 Tax=Novosphingobium clariflavum TaxID=2029884 RepID=A0ABV6SAJ9_9SPHN|nr:hypothetical protein [Novosphingobium clariflavum]